MSAAAAEVSPVIEAWCAGLRPTARETVDEWASKHVYLPQTHLGSKFDAALSPWLVEPLREASDNSNRSICLLAAVGAGKTTFFEALIPWVVSEDPGSMFFVAQSDDDAKDWAESRLAPMLDKCEPLQGLFPERRNDRRKTEILFPHMPFWIVGANKSSLQSKSIRWVFGDECWMWGPGMMEEARRRHHDRWNRRSVFVSQGGFEGTDWHRAWKNSDQREYEWQCEGCGGWHPYRWADIGWEEKREDDGTIRIAETMATVHMRCPADGCGATYEDSPVVRRRLSSGARYRPTNDNFEPGHLGFHVSALAVWWIDWGDLVAGWLRANEAKSMGDRSELERFIQKRLAEFWSADFGEKRGPLTPGGYSKSDYSEGQKWEGESDRYLTADRQMDHLWAVVRAWGSDGSSRLLWEGKVLTWEGLRDLQERLKVPDKMTFVDSRYDKAEVYRNCRRFGWVAVQGSNREGFKHTRPGALPVWKFFSPAQWAAAPGGGRVLYVVLATERLKDMLAVLRSGQGASWQVPDDVSAAYTSQIDAEVKRDVVNGTTNQVTQRWVKTRPNHLWDCEYYQVAAALIRGRLAVPGAVESAGREEA